MTVTGITIVFRKSFIFDIIDATLVSIVLYTSIKRMVLLNKYRKRMALNIEESLLCYTNG